MIDEWSADRTGWARFSDDRRFRYRLARSLNPERPLVMSAAGVLHFGAPFAGTHRLVFLMLNPSTADAFVLDPTVRECCKRARALGAGILEVVNLFALRSTDPAELKKCGHGFRGDDTDNDQQILDACEGSVMVIAAWGNHGQLGNRDLSVQRALRAKGIQLHHLGVTGDGYPKHPLARGRHRIPAWQEPMLWSEE